jgi:hypothetical protein
MRGREGVGPTCWAVLHAGPGCDDHVFSSTLLAEPRILSDSAAIGSQVHLCPLTLSGRLGCLDVERGVPMPHTVETDARSRVVLPGHPDQRFVVQENEDGSILLQPAQVVTLAQLEYEENPELQALLARAASSRTVRRRRR